MVRRDENGAAQSADRRAGGVGPSDEDTIKSAMDGGSSRGCFGQHKSGQTTRLPLSLREASEINVWEGLALGEHLYDNLRDDQYSLVMTGSTVSGNWPGSYHDYVLASFVHVESENVARSRVHLSYDSAFPQLPYITRLAATIPGRTTAHPEAPDIASIRTCSAPYGTTYAVCVGSTTSRSVEHEASHDAAWTVAEHHLPTTPTAAKVAAGLRPIVKARPNHGGISADHRFYDHPSTRDDYE